MVIHYTAVNKHLERIAERGKLTKRQIRMAHKINLWHMTEVRRAGLWMQG
jgi:hypothetical protein